MSTSLDHGKQEWLATWREGKHHWPFPGWGSALSSGLPQGAPWAYLNALCPINVLAFDTRALSPRVFFLLFEPCIPLPIRLKCRRNTSHPAIPASHCTVIRRATFLYQSCSPSRSKAGLSPRSESAPACLCSLFTCQPRSHLS